MELLKFSIVFFKIKTKHVYLLKSVKIQLLLVSKFRKKFNFSKIYWIEVYLSLAKPKIVYLRPLLSSLPFPKI